MTMNDGAPHAFLPPTTYVDSDADNVVAFARRVTDGVADPVARAVALYYAVRDEITYTAYCNFKSDETYRASGCLARGAGFCVGKAALLAAAARAADIPARVGFADVRNHLTSARLRRLMTTDVFYYHGYAELYLDGVWVKATAVFDKTLCERVGIRPLEFDGRHDALFHAFDASGRRHMEYVRDRGARADVPVVEIIEAFARYYPGLIAMGAAGPVDRFRNEAAVEYTMSAHGFLAPASVVHREYIDDEVQQENIFGYSPFRLFSADAEIKFTELPSNP
jgi:hypothetical protein